MADTFDGFDPGHVLAAMVPTPADPPAPREEKEPMGNHHFQPSGALVTGLTTAQSPPSSETIREALKAIQDASDDGMGLIEEIAECDVYPYRWQYPNVYLTDDYAYMCAREAARHGIRALRLLGLWEAPAEPQEGR